MKLPKLSGSRINHHMYFAPHITLPTSSSSSLNKSLKFASNPRMSATFSLLLLPPPTKPHHVSSIPSKPISPLLKSKPTIPTFTLLRSASKSDVDMDPPSSSDLDPLVKNPTTFEITAAAEESQNVDDGYKKIWEWVLLVSPFFFWGTAMVAMKEVIPKTGPFFVSSVRLIPAGALLVGFAAAKGRKQPSGLLAWISIVLFGVVDAACFQGFLAEGLQKTSAGLGSVIIDSQPLTVAILAALLFGESIGAIGASGLVLGVIGLLLLEVPALEENNSTIWGSGEWWMLLAAQSMAIGTVMVRWVSKYSDTVMATGWHMVLGGLPLLAISFLNNDPAVRGSLKDLTSSDLLALLYTSIFGSAVSYGVYFFNATRGSLTQLSSLTFLTPMFASIFGFLYLGETFSPVQLVGALVTVIAIYMVNYRQMVNEE